MPARILIADDHEVVRQGVRAMILRSRPQWEICGDAANGDEALQAIQSLKPDVAVLDITMPGMSGLEVAYGSHPAPSSHRAPHVHHARIFEARRRDSRGGRSGLRQQVLRRTRPYRRN